MNDQREFPRDAMRRGEKSALRRAGQQAREIAAITGTPLVIYREGKVEQCVVDGATPEETGPPPKSD